MTHDFIETAALIVVPILRMGSSILLACSPLLPALFATEIFANHL